MVDIYNISRKDLGKLFDHSVLGKNATEKDIREGCRIARKYNCAAFYSATSYWTPVVKEELAGTDILIGTGVAFPGGAAPVELKKYEAELAVDAGCTAVDLIINVGAVLDGRYDITRKELEMFKMVCTDKAVTKVILETCFLSNEQIQHVCQLVREIGLDYAKTSTGQFEGPTMEQFMIMKRTLEGSDVKLKVAGVKFPRPQNAYAFIMAGADLIGTRASAEIIDSYDLMKEIGIISSRRG